MRRYASFVSVFVGILALSLGLGGCDAFNLGDDELSGLNQNPNASTEPGIDALLANGQREIAFSWFGADPTMRGTNLLAQYTTQNQYASDAIYQTIDYGFGGFYLALNDLEKVKELVRQREDVVPSQRNTVAVAMVHQVWTFQILTDVYGSIPFTEALQGPSNPSPAYTPQQEIYPALVDSLDAALGLIQTDAEGPSGDLVYDGDMQKWQRFANALKMRIGMRMADANPEEAQAAVESAAGNAFQSNDDNAFFQFATSSQHRSTIFENRFVEGRNDFDASDRFVNIMTQQYDVTDPRSSTYFTPSTANSEKEYHGFPYGLTPSGAASLKSQHVDAYFSRPGERFVKADVQAPMMLYDEVLFIKAEAAQRGWNVTGDATSNFEAAVRASIDWWNPDAGSDRVDAYVDAVMSDLNTSSFEQVLGEQKWIALYFQGVQGWSEWRRLDFEGWIQEPSGGFGGQAGGNVTVPVRLDYPDSEFSVNEANVRAAAEQQFGSVQADHLGSRIWWDTEAPPAGALP